jgi:Sulfocyanin (SoxE) domain
MLRRGLDSCCLLLGIGWIPAPALAQSDTPPRWIVPDPAAKSVTLTLEVVRPAGARSAQLNGEHDGSVQINVPLNWTVHWIWRNSDSVPHSLVVVAEREKLPTEGGHPALENAASRAVITGIAPGKTDETTFVADQAGWYWILCGIPGHALAGEWIGLRIDPAATGVSLKRKAG